MPQAWVDGDEALCDDCAADPGNPPSVTDMQLPVDTMRCDRCDDLLDQVYRVADTLLDPIEKQADRLNLTVDDMLEAINEVA